MTETDTQAAYDALLDLAYRLGAPGVLPDDDERLRAVAALAQIGLQLGEIGRACDACDVLADAEVYAVAGYTWAEDRNRWDDVVEVAICPPCEHAAREAALEDEYQAAQEEGPTP